MTHIYVSAYVMHVGIISARPEYWDPGLCKAFSAAFGMHISYVHVCYSLFLAHVHTCTVPLTNVLLHACASHTRAHVRAYIRMKMHTFMHVLINPKP